jgi:hypothetical protein
MRRTGGGACAGDYAASLGKVPLPVAKLTGRVSGFASLATRLGLDLDTLYLLQTAVQSEREGGRGSRVSRRAPECLHDKPERTDQLSQEVTSRGRFLCVCESCGASSTKRRLSMMTIIGKWLDGMLR